MRYIVRYKVKGRPLLDLAPSWIKRSRLIPPSQHPLPNHGIGLGLRWDLSWPCRVSFIRSFLIFDKYGCEWIWKIDDGMCKVCKVTYLSPHLSWPWRFLSFFHSFIRSFLLFDKLDMNELKNRGWDVQGMYQRIWYSSLAPPGVGWVG